MLDLREELLRKIMTELVGVINNDNTDKLRNILVKCIGEYRISERCMDHVSDGNNNEEMIRLFLATKRTEGGSTETESNRGFLYKRFCSDIGKPLNSVSTFDIRSWLSKEQERVQLSTAESYRNALSSLFSWLHEEGMVDRNPMANIKPIRHPKPIRKSFTPVEIDSMKSACKTKLDRAMIEILLSSGIRCEELCNLKWSDIDFVTKDIHVIEGKGNKNRITMMDDVTCKYLKAYKKSLKYSSEYVFSVRYRGKIKQRTTDSVWRHLKGIGERAGVSDVYPHRFRHTFATNLYRRGLDLNVIKNLLGHASINTTLIYIDSDIDLIRDAYKKCS